MDTEELTATENKDEESELEATVDRSDRKKKEIQSAVPCASGTKEIAAPCASGTKEIAAPCASGTKEIAAPCASGTSVSSKTPLELSLIPPQFTQNSTSRTKGSQEYIVPLISLSPERTLLVAADVAGVSNVSSSGSHKSDSGSSVTPEFDMFDDEPVILSTPACQVLGIIMNKQFFKNSAASETENNLIRMYFAEKIPPEREKDAREALEKAVSLAVTRVKSSGLSEDLYSFLNNNRAMAISLMIDAMKYRKKEFVPEFWIYDRTNKNEPPSEPSS
ncbi:hypothetical protein LOAG_09214 [Loa loa]|uniref:Uncharacterized protein n=1 Tax=Loa loa TaxID=7209 RepID=A0A1I7VCM3_LOALO|nr:hypothetical protein LOAG_09214 [Loa loa]EFO19282.1 hypothetical protein LOAG_09214 [Loa loa]